MNNQGIVLCLDYGNRFVGVAVTDSEGKLALRHSVIDQRKQDSFREIVRVVGQESVGKVLVGLPLNLERQDTDQTRTVREFMEKLRGELPAGVAVEEIDEIMSSVEARRHIQLEGTPKNEEHAEAARIMLDDYLRSRLERQAS